MYVKFEAQERGMLYIGSNRKRTWRCNHYCWTESAVSSIVLGVGSIILSVFDEF